MPLLHEIAWRHDETPSKISAGNHLLDKQTRHNSFAGTWIIRQNIAQRHARQHFLINGLDLVGQRLNGRGSYGQIGIE